MSTIRQIQANQLNARQSTGPRSIEGKAVVSMNALQSGLDAKSVIIRESPADFETLTTQYYDRWLPTAPEQRALINALIASEWLNRRYLRLEAHLWEGCMPSQDRLRPNIFLSQALISGDHLFDKLARHKNSALRNYHVALHDLERLKKEERKQELAATSPDPVAANSAPIGPLSLHPIDPPPTSTPIGSVPQKAASEVSLLPPALGPRPLAPVPAPPQPIH